jgi:hypothetical protein
LSIFISWNGNNYTLRLIKFKQLKWP